LYQSHYHRVLGLSRRLLGSQQEAEDAAIEVFLKVPRALSTYKASQDFSPWLLTVAKHHCVDQLRRRKTERQHLVAWDAGSMPLKSRAGSPLAVLLDAEQQSRVRREVNRLPENYRLPLALQYLCEMSYEEIATALGLQRNTVATLIHRAKKVLRRRLQPPRPRSIGEE
jgi:RNA polymerase sigma-70 factor (ECF subfamily)